MTVSLCTPHGIPLQITSSGHITFSMFRVRAGLTWRWFLKISYILSQDNMRKQKKSNNTKRLPGMASSSSSNQSTIKTVSQMGEGVGAFNPT